MGINWGSQVSAENIDVHLELANIVVNVPIIC